MNLFWRYIFYFFRYVGLYMILSVTKCKLVCFLIRFIQIVCIRIWSGQVKVESNNLLLLLFCWILFILFIVYAFGIGIMAFCFGYSLSFTCFASLMFLEYSFSFSLFLMTLFFHNYFCWFFIKEKGGFLGT